MTESETELFFGAALRQERMRFADVSAQVLADCGVALAAFGFAPGVRRSLGLSAQMAGELATVAALALETRRGYAGAALVKQLLEIEFLFATFLADPREITRWIESDQKALRRDFSPKELRRKANGSFKDEDYWGHCMLGGHPNPSAAFLLDHRIENHDLPGVAVVEWELAFHAGGTTQRLQRILDDHQLSEIGRIPEAIAPWGTAPSRWRELDRWATSHDSVPEPETASSSKE